MTAVFNESYATVREFYPGFMTLRHALSLSQELRQMQRVQHEHVLELVGVIIREIDEEKKDNES